MGDIKASGFGGIAHGVNATRPSNPDAGTPFFNGEANRLELYTQATGWQNIVQETPSVVSVQGAAKQSGASTVTINGTNFAVGCSATVIGTNGVETNAQSTTLISVVQLTATLPSLDPAYEPYDVKVVNPSNLYGVLYDALPVDNSPIWGTSSGSLGSYTELSSVSITLAASDAVDTSSTSLVYSLTSGSLPNGLSLSSGGVISGTPTDVQSNTTYSFVVSISDGQNTIPRSFSITITDRGPVWSTTSPLSSFSSGISYTTTLSATDDNGVVSYSIFSGVLPTGLSLNTSSGVISGTPSSSSTATFTVRATDSLSSNYTDRQFTMPNAGPVWGATSSYSVPISQSYSQQLSATDDYGTPTYSVASGTLPSGLALSSSGLVSGTSAATGTVSVVFRATDANGTYSDKTISFIMSVVNAWANIADTGFYQTEGIGGIYNGSLWVGGGQNPTINNPAWKSINLSTGAVTNKANCPVGRDEAMGLWVGSKFYIPGGYSNNSVQNTRFDVYDAGTDSWSTLTALSTAPTYADLGTDGTNLYMTSSTPLAVMQRYNISAGTWTTLASLSSGWNTGYPPQKMNYHNGKFYLIAQKGSVNNGYYTLVSYDIASNTWQESLAPAGQYVNSFSNYNIGSGKINDKIYFFGHTSSGTNGSIYNITSNTWSLMSNPSTDWTVVGDSDGSSLYYHGGWTPGGSIGNTYLKRYTPYP